MPAELPPPSLRLRVDEDALRANWRLLDTMSGTASAGAAVKANGYGLGVDRVVPILRDAGASSFFVAHWSEVPAVIAHVPADQVAVLHGPLSDADCRFARETGALPVINSLDQARRWTASEGGPCHLMVDTGINRLGLSMHEIGDEAVAALQVEVLLSHLASADEDCTLNARQLARFRDAAATIGHRALSLANSAGIALGHEYAFDLTRPGLSLYGGVPRDELGEIRQVAFPQVSLIQTRTIQPGETVGYNATFTAEREMRVGVVSLGYADGYLRCWSGVGAMHHDGTALPVLGRVSMDMVVIDLTEAANLREGDWLDVPFDLPFAAKTSGLSQYELLTTLGARFG